MTGPDFRLGGLQPAHAYDDLPAGSSMWAGDLTVLAEHHAEGPEQVSYLIAYDASATWAGPGADQLVAIHITRDMDRQSFTFDTRRHATFAFAQKWLIERGCPPEPVTRLNTEVIQPADEHTLIVERQIRTSGDRYHVISSCTADRGDDAVETWTMVHDCHAELAPIRLFLEDADLRTFTYTLCEGAFADEEAARHWLDNRGKPLPGPPLEERGPTAAERTRAALTRSTGRPLAAEGSAPATPRNAAVPNRPPRRR